MPVRRHTGPFQIMEWLHTATVLYWLGKLPVLYLSTVVPKVQQKDENKVHQEAALTLNRSQCTGICGFSNTYFVSSTAAATPSIWAHHHCLNTWEIVLPASYQGHVLLLSSVTLNPTPSTISSALEKFSASFYRYLSFSRQFCQEP